MDPLSAAREELAHKTRAQIESETADAWTWRAVAAYEQVTLCMTSTAQLQWILDAASYEAEAREHAAGCGTQKLAQVEGLIARVKLRFTVG